MVKYRILPLLAVGLAGVALAAGCGSGNRSVPASAVAIVGNDTITKDEFEQVIDQYCAQQPSCPKAGTQEYTTLRGQAILALVQRAEFEQKADELDINVSDADVEKRLKELKKQYFNNDEKKYQAALKRQHLTDEKVRADLRNQLIQQEIYNNVTTDVKVTDEEISDYYKKNQRQYVQPATRAVRHILVKKKGLADRIYAQLTQGADFAALAKRYSQDPSSKTKGGKLTVSKGTTVPEFDKAAFSLPVRKLSKPIKTQYGWHIIQPLAGVKKEIKTPLSQVREAIRQQLVSQGKQQKMTDWVKKTQDEFEPKTSYQIGYAPPAETGTLQGTTTTQ
ncbi:MAG TPA: peptidylprolyl isomerase [Gaiellaceae bacterium]|jgi:parvulin-like peptidyl-prolyl isomerase|nr:peptidylprolyl isomerase [Gaiellaceae bacterium]